MLTFNELAKNLAELNSCPVADAEAFLRELFALAAEELESEGAVEVPSLGRFAIMDGKVIFQPDDELASELNAPFADFEPVELPSGFSLTEEAEKTDNSGKSESSEPESEPQPESEPECEPELEPEPEPEAEPVIPPYNPPVAPLSGRPSEPKVIVKKRGVSYCVAVVIGLLGLIAGYILGYLTSPDHNDIVVIDPITDPIEIETDSNTVVTRTEYADTVLEVEALEVTPATVVLDTIRPGRFLTTMARQHYGKKDYWVYIYEANASKLGNPDLLESGTIVVIPPADSLGLDPGNSEKIAEANRKAQEIYGRFN